jgi:hypothetical protein
VARELSRALAAYDADLDLLVERRWDPELYMKIGDEFSRVRTLATLLPALSVAWGELLISRVELSHCLWAGRPATRLDGHSLGLHARHKAVIAQLQRQCAAVCADPPL